MKLNDGSKYQRRLNDLEVLAIAREHKKPGITLREVADKFGIAVSTVVSVVKNPYRLERARENLRTREK